MVELCHRDLDGLGLLDEWSLGVVVPIFKGKDDIMIFICYRALYLFAHGMKVVN